MVVANPWECYDIPGDVCIPDDNDVPSFKFRLRMRGTLVTSNTFGFIVGNPLGFANAGIASLFHTNASTFAGANIPATGAPPTGSVYQNSNSPFNGGVAGRMPRTRCVAFGIRIRYSGTELNRGGSLIPWRARNITGSNCTNWLFSDFAAANQSTVKAVKRKWVGTVFTPVNAEDRRYITVDDAALGLGVQSSSRTVALAITAPGASVTYDYDVVGYYESITYGDGSQEYAVPSVSSSDSDSVGYSFVRDTYAKFADSEIGQVAWDAFKAASGAWISQHVPFATGSSAATIGWR
jgi:hypothetical protein